MRVDEWIQVAGVVATVLLAIATFGGPVYAAQISKRYQDETPDEGNQGWFERFRNSAWLRSPWRLPPLIILICTIQLVLDFRRTDPMTKGLVFHIAFNMAGVVWGAVLLIAALIGQEITSQWKILKFQRDVIRELVNAQSSVAETVKVQAENDRGIVDILRVLAPKADVGKLLENIASIKDELEKVKEKTEHRAWISGLFKR